MFLDEFDDDTSGWGGGESGAVSAQYTNGSMQLDVGENGQAVWSTRALDDPLAVIQLAGDFRPISVNAAFGPLCEGDDGSLYGIAVTSDGSLSFISIVNNVAQVLDTHEGLVTVPPVGAMTIGLECTAMSSGALRLVAVGAEGPQAYYQTNDGPQTFTGTAVYTEATGDSARVDVDTVVVFGIPGSPEGMTGEGEDLLTHVPGDLQSTCYEAPSSGTPNAVLHCVLQPSGVGAELLQFQGYDSNDDMDTAYQQLVSQFGVESTGTCKSGPNETTWSLGENDRGRVQCAPQQVGIRFDWTDDVLSILSTLVDFDSDYENTYNMWLNAGPVDSPI